MIEYSERIEVVADWIKHSKHLVIFTGAGISTNSGIPDYRGPNGVWTRRDQGLPPPKLKKTRSQIQPNEGHMVIKQFQDMGLLKYLISQNVDNLHLKSGIQMEFISELHGNWQLMRCLECEKIYPTTNLWDKKEWGNGYLTDPIRKNQPTCPECYGRIISSIVNFGDPMPTKVLRSAIHHSKESDVFIVVGSSLLVAPASHMPKYAKNQGARLVIINQMKTPLDEIADILFNEDASQVLLDIKEKIMKKK